MGYVVYGSGLVIGVSVGVVGVYYPDFTLDVLSVTIEYCDLFGVGGDCSAFEEDE